MADRSPDSSHSADEGEHSGLARAGRADERRHALGRYLEGHAVVDIGEVVGVAEADVVEGEGRGFGAGGGQLGGQGRGFGGEAQRLLDAGEGRGARLVLRDRADDLYAWALPISHA
jgi:hypothetical protein